jgi:glucokinase
MTGVNRIAAVDIGGTKIAVGVIDGEGRVLSKLECPTDAQQGYAKALERIVRMIHDLNADTGGGIQGIGIGSTGPVDPLTGEIGDVNFLPGWLGENPVRDLEQAFRIPVAMENDADAAALAEAGWGAGKNKQRLVYVTVGTGIGGGIIFDGHVYRGVDHAHPEIGHHLIDPSGPACLCGFHGCWESLAAGPAMVQWVEANMPPDYPHRANLSAKRICELAREGDPLALRSVQRETRYLGLGLSNVVTMFTPDSIVLSGSVMKSADLFLEGVHKIIRESCKFVPFAKTEITMASLGEDANLIGAARVWHHRFSGGDRA